MKSESNRSQPPSLPWLGVRSFARKLLAAEQTARAERDAAQAQLARIAAMGRELVAEVKELRSWQEVATQQLDALGGLPILELEIQRRDLERKVLLQTQMLEFEKAQATAALEKLKCQLAVAREQIVATTDIALLQEAGVYEYRHPLTDIVAYEEALERLQDSIKAMVKREGHAVLASTNWTVNGSIDEGRAMIRDFSKLMLRAFNAEADNLVRHLKPYKLAGALDRLKKVAETIEKLGRSMNIRIAPAYYQLRVDELTLTADFLQKEDERKEAERLERERLREERKVQQEIERERTRLEKERQHYSNALDALVAKGDDAGATRIKAQLAEVEQNIEKVDFRSANIRAGHVYIISNIGSFGEKMIKVGMTRRLEPMDRIRELSDASVPFNFDVHALFFSSDAVGIENAMHNELAHLRVNTVNQRREFFHATPLEAKTLLSKFNGELVEYREFPEALEYRQCLNSRRKAPSRSETP